MATVRETLSSMITEQWVSMMVATETATEEEARQLLDVDALVALDMVGALAPMLQNMPESARELAEAHIDAKFSKSH